MIAILLRLRSEARVRWQSWLLLAILAGLVGGAAIGALAGARRTETSYPRFLEGTNAFDVLVTNGGTTETNTNRQFDFDDVGRLPYVADSARVSYFFPSGTTPSGRAILPSDVTPFASPDGRFGVDLNRAHVLEGRLPEGQTEVAVTLAAAERVDLDVGDTLRLQLSGPQAMADAFTKAGRDPAGPVADGTEAFLVVGMVAMESGIPPLTGGIPPPILLSPAYAVAHPDASEVLAVRLHRGRVDIAAFEQELDRLAGGEQVVTTNEIEQTSVVQRSLGVQSAALRVMAAALVLVALLLLGQALARQAFVDSGDHRVLLALGITPAQLAVLGLTRAFLIALVAAPAAAITAVAMSPLTPVGVARHTELQPGLEVNVAYTGVGAAAVLVVVWLLGVWPAWRSAKPAASPRHPDAVASRWTSMMARAGFPAPAVSGMRMALEPGRGRSAVPLRSTIMSVGLALATIAAALTFSASLANLFDDPQLYGWNWDIQLGDAFSPSLREDAERLSEDPAVRAVAVGTISRLQIGHLRVDTMASEALTGSIEPTVIAGRAPTRPTEILLGTRTLRDLGLAVGDTVTVGSGDRESQMQVVGRGVLTEFAGAARLGEGAAVTLEGMRRILPDAVPDVMLLRLQEGAGGTALRSRLVEAPPANIYLPTKPTDLADLDRVGGIPSIVAGLLGAMAVATLAHTLLASVRRRRRDLAILKVLGFVRGQVSATVAWQSTVLAIVGAILGVPLGIAGGYWAWQLFADRLGVPPQPTTPLGALILLVPAAVLLANLIAWPPGLAAARTRPTAVLRSE